MLELIRELQTNPYAFAIITFIALISAVPSLVTVGSWIKVAIGYIGRGIYVPWNMINISANDAASNMKNENIATFWCAQAILRSLLLFGLAAVMMLMAVVFVIFIISDVGLVNKPFFEARLSLYTSAVIFVVWILDSMYSGLVLKRARSMPPLAPCR